MKCRAGALVALAAVAALQTSPPRAVAQVPAAGTVVAYKVGLEELKKALNGAIQGADFALQQKLRSATAQVELLLGRLQEFETKGITDLNQVVAGTQRPLAEMLSSLQASLAQTEQQAMLDVNGAIANAAGALTALPLTRVEPFLGAVSPKRILPSAADKRVQLVGYFGAAVKDHPVEVRVSGRLLAASRSTSGVAVDLPADLPLPENSFVPVTVRAPYRRGLFRVLRWAEFTDRLFVARERPYACTFSVLRPNPAYMIEVAAPAEHHEWASTQAGNNRPGNTGSISARQLIEGLVPQATTLYDTATTTILEPRCRTWANTPCQHVSAPASFTWSADQISWTLAANSKGGHWHGPLLGGYQHGGGGSHSNVACAPLFRVGRRDVPLQVADPPTPFPLARNAGFTAPLQVPSANWGLTVHCAFDEGDRRFERTLSMSQTQRQAVSDALHAEVNGANVLLVNSLN